MKKSKDFLTKYKKYLYIGAPVLLIILFFVFRGGESNTEAYTVKLENIEQSVKLSGDVRTSDRADLGFASSGRIVRIPAQNNQNVYQGQVLAQLEIGDLLADLKIKQLNAQTSNVGLEDAKKELAQVTAQENTKVKNAERTMLSEDLEVIQNSNTYTVAAPTIGGLYNGAEGQYKLNIQRDGSDTKILTFGVERSERVINEQGSTPLGTKGLYISFPDEIEDYTGTIWYIDIPNKSSSSYLANFNAYNEAREARDLAIQNAKAEYEKLLTEGGNEEYSIAQAEIQKINAEIRKNTIYAPFNGIVTNIEKEVGENAGVGERVVSVLGEEKLEIVLQVSELDVSRLTPGLPIAISIDAIPEEEFNGVLKTVNSRETEVDGVPVYEAFVELEADPRIKTGMSASGKVVLDKKDNVIAIPSYLVRKEGNQNFVNIVMADGSTVEKEVTLGLLGSDSMVEVISGLAAGDTLVPVSE